MHRSWRLRLEFAGWKVEIGFLLRKLQQCSAAVLKGRSGRQDELRELVPFSSFVLVVIVVCRCVALID